MALTPLANRDAQAAALLSPVAQKTASQFSKAAQQASRVGEAANTAGSEGKNAAMKPDPSRVQGRGERDQGQGGHHHTGKQTRIVDGEKITIEDGRVTRVSVGSHDAKVTISNAATAFEPLRNLGQIVTATGRIIPATPHPLESRSSRPGETTKTSSDNSTGNTSFLSTEAAIRGENNETPSGGGKKKDGKDGNPDGDKSNDVPSDGNDNMDDIGGGRNKPPGGGTPAAGAAPDPDDFDGSELTEDQRTYFQALANRGIPDDVAMWIARTTNIGQDSVDHIADLFESLRRHIDDPSEIVAKAGLCVRGENSSVLADFLEELVLFAGDCIFDGHSRQSTLASALSIVDAIVSMPRPSSGNSTNVANVLTLARFIVVNGVAPADVAACVGMESMNGGTAGFIASVVLQSETELGWHNMVPEEIVNKVRAAADYMEAYDVSILGGAQYDGLSEVVRDILSGSLRGTAFELPSGEESSTPRRERFQRWQAVGQMFNLSDEQADDVNRLLAAIELSQNSYDYDGSAPQFRHSLKAMASFLIADRERGYGSTADEALELIDTLLTAKSNLSGREEIICNSAAFIMNYPYRDRNSTAEAMADLREAFALTTQHDIFTGSDYQLLLVLSELRDNGDYAALDEDLLRSPERDAVMAYLMSGSGSPLRLADVAITMMATGLPADEAALHFDVGKRAERASRWAQVTPSNTELSSFNQALLLEDALSVLVGEDVSLLDTMAAPLDAFIRQGFSADAGFSCLASILKSWNWDPLGQFLEPGFSTARAADEPLFEILSNEDRAFLSVQDSLAQFPTDIITRLADNGLRPEDVADLLVGTGSENSLVPFAQKHTISILQAISGTLTLSKLQELVPYLNESRRPAMLLTAVAQSFLGVETQLAELELLLSDGDAQMRWALNANTRNSMAIETALCELFNIYDFPEVYLDLETAETTLITNNFVGNIELQSIEDWRAARNVSARLVLDPESRNYIEFSCNRRFNVQFPGQATSKPAETLQEGYYGLRMLPPGTTIIVVSVSGSSAPRTTVFKLPPVRSRLEE